ncbi:hypothetical protein GCM10027180_01940 [Microbulbifer echini]
MDAAYKKTFQSVFCADWGYSKCYSWPQSRCGQGTAEYWLLIIKNWGTANVIQQAFDGAVLGAVKHSGSSREYRRVHDGYA